MTTSLRAKLALITAIAAIALAIVAASSGIAATKVTERLVAIRERYVPRVEIRPRLENEFEQLRRGLQDAVAAQDPELIDPALAHRDAFERLLARGGTAIDASDSAELRRALDEYVATAAVVSRRLISGEMGEDLVDAMATMQRRQARVTSLIERTTAFRQDELDRAFTSALSAQRDATRVLVFASLACIVLTTFLTWWLGRGMLGSVRELTLGFTRIGRGEFDRPIATRGTDELAQLATSANAMAASLSNLASERERAKWLKDGVAGLAERLRGELSLAEASDRALRYVIDYVEAHVGAVYAIEDDSSLALTASHALAIAPSEFAPPTKFARGEGLVGQAALDGHVVVLDRVPSGYLHVRSGVVAGDARTIALVPLLAGGQTLGVLEIGTMGERDSLPVEFLTASSETIAIAIQVARSRNAMRDLLVAAQHQAQRLAAQEEELRATNEELESQQEELRATNEELTQQTWELESQRKVVEEKNRELEDARQTLEQKALELATTSAYKSQFLANMSHELRTPLNSMLLLSSLLSENSTGNLTTKQVEYCKTVHSAGVDLLALINQVLDLAKIESGKQEVRFETVRIDAIASQLRGVFEPLAANKGLAFAIEVDPSVPESFTTDRQRLAQVLTNLFGNAIKFTDSGRVEMRVRTSGPGTATRRPDLASRDLISFSISDTGAGIAPEHRDKIFEPFEQADVSTERRFGGTGLGLAIARELAALLGGEIDLESTLGVGSTFVLRLPLTAAVTEAAEIETPAETGTVRPIRIDPEPRAPDEGPPLVLLIEDDPVFAEAFSELVASQGLRCSVATDGASGIRAAQTERPSGIVLDIGLPDIDGFAVLERLRADPSTSKIPVHVVSAADGTDRARMLGAIGYLKKPASKDELLRSLHALVPRRQNDAFRVLVVEDNAIVGDSLVAMLALEGIAAHRVGTADQALRALDANQFRCVVVDLSLPDMDGLELLRVLERRDEHSRPPVIVYTARGLSKAETQAIERYAEAVVLKEGPSMARVLDEIKLFTRNLRDRVSKRTVARPDENTSTKLAGRTLLLVDDDMRTVYALSAMLQSRGAEIVLGDTGKAALEALDAHPDVDAVLMDIMMPEMDGYEAMRRIRAQPRFRALPIIALTAKAMLGDEAKCLEAGASAYLPKPIDPARLFQTLANHMEEATR